MSDFPTQTEDNDLFLASLLLNCELLLRLQMEAEIAQQNKIQASIRQETYLLKKSANELKDQIANLSIALRELQAEERQLSKEIVHSPDRIKVDLADAIQQLERMKKNIVEKQSEKNTVQKQLKHTSSAEESLRQFITTDLREMEAKVKSYKLAVKDLGEWQNKLRGMEQDLEEKKQVNEMQKKQLEAVRKSAFLRWRLNTFSFYPRNLHIMNNHFFSLSIIQKNVKRKPRPHSPRCSSLRKTILILPRPN